MKTYTLHLPPDAAPGDHAALEKAELVKDGFSWGAFLFTFLWFVANRLWLAGLGVLLLLIAFTAALSALNVQPGAALVAQLLLQGLIGLEANGLKRWTYARRGRPAVDVVTAADQQEAEVKAFARWLKGANTPARVPSPGSLPAYRGSDSVIGLFPDPEVRR